MSKKKTHAEYVAELAVKNPDIEVVGIYMGNKVKIPHRCKIHEIIWDAAPNNTLNGCGCSECKKEKSANWDIMISLNTAINRLKDKEKKIITERFLLGKTQMEIAEEIGISQAQVSRLEKGGIENIKKMIM